jgi:collagenase-like PrtC family protease
MNNDLISREALKKAITDRLVSVTYSSDYTDGLQDGYLNTINEIDNAPTVEAEKVKEDELVKAYTKGFDTGVETVRPQGECQNYIHKYKCDFYNENHDNCKKCGMRGEEE